MNNDSKILISDFDGTMTRYDFYELVRTQLLSPSVPDYWQQYFDGKLTHFEALAAYFAEIRCDEARLLQLADSMELVPNLKTAISQLTATGWQLAITSAGCQWYIDYHFERAGVQPKVYSNPGVFIPGQGLLMSYPDKDAFYSKAIGVDKQAVVKDALGKYTQVAFAGDGKPDVKPALLVQPELRFARGWLAEKLSSLNEPFHSFNVWSDIVNVLTRKESP